jgi:hypothetical protein
LTVCAAGRSTRGLAAGVAVAERAAMPLRLAFVALLLAGCITHLPPRTREHLTISWARGFDDACRRAASERKPILAILVAGQIDGPC